MRVGIRPPGLADSFDDCSPEDQARILAYDQIKTREENDEFEVQLKARGALF